MNTSDNFVLKMGIIVVLIINSFIGCAQNVNLTTLTTSEKEGILLMREEEKLAHDVYSFFAQKYNIPIFRNITNSEVEHQKLVIQLMDQYGIKDSSYEEESKFHNKELQELYDQLTVQGNTLIDALKIGAYIEELDIHDLKQLMKETDNEVILGTYDPLLWGSQNHLRAFVRNLTNRGVEYQPVFLSAEEFYSILNK
ncbi:MAG: DUF2202 domain-containing protein [Bacteroidales bacterium]|jgi:hypothetical protein|nr:DUF2202 domain-containing protein [Bacteroidales bacterium]